MLPHFSFTFWLGGCDISGSALDAFFTVFIDQVLYMCLRKLISVFLLHYGMSNQNGFIFYVYSFSPHYSKIRSVIKLFSLSYISKSRKENPQKLTQLSSRSHPRHLVGKRTAQKDITIDTTSDSQVNSNFPNKWSPASLTFNNYFYLFLYLYIT